MKNSRVLLNTILVLCLCSLIIIFLICTGVLNSYKYLLITIVPLGIIGLRVNIAIWYPAIILIPELFKKKKEK